jgi:peroxiredoxin (alkyl hydroperoxide reductase subunit C)
MPLPSIRSKAPAFTADALYPSKEIKSLSLSSYLGKWVVFFWYPLDFTFVCPTEIIAFGDRQPDFDAINTQVIGASCDSKFTHLAWVNTPRADGGLGDMQIPLVADFTREVAEAYGVLLPLTDGGDPGVPLRALFIIDPTGTLRQITVNDLPVGRNVDEIIRLIKAFQFNEKYGEVCPANWQPGDLTMKADPLESKTYFQAANTTGVISITSKEQFTQLIASPTLTVVDFWAPWCKNCKKITPLIEKLTTEISTVRFAKINTQELEELSVELQVDALPTLQFYKNSVKIGEFKGSDLKAVEQAIKSYV